LFQPKKYIVGEQYEIHLNKVKQFEGVIVDIKRFMLHDVNEFVAHIDTGYTKEKCQKIIQTMYPKVDFSITPISLILIKKI
jgi:hypothetical protein